MLPVLLSLQDDPSDHVRHLMAFHLAGHPDAIEACEALAQLLNDSNATVRGRAALSLAGSNRRICQLCQSCAKGSPTMTVSLACTRHTLSVASSAVPTHQRWRCWAICFERATANTACTRLATLLGSAKKRQSFSDSWPTKSGPTRNWPANVASCSVKLEPRLFHC
jgi:hypothetical protein